VVAKSPEAPRPSREYADGFKAIAQLIYEDGSWSGHERDVCFLNLGDGRFVEISGVAGLDFGEDGRSFALVDLDRDGDLEILLKQRNAPQLRVLRNDTPTENRSLALRLRGRPEAAAGPFRSSRDAVGALIDLETPRGKLTKQVVLGSGFLSQSTLDVYFGLGAAAGPFRAVITWPSGRTQSVEGLPADHRIVITEGEATFQAAPFRPRNADLAPCAPQSLPPNTPKADGTPLVEPVPTPTFSLPNLRGETVTSQSLLGRPVLLNFWATWCKPCQEEMRQWASDYAGLRSAGLELVAVSVDEPGQRASVERFASERQLPFPVLLADFETVRRFDVFTRALLTRSTGLQVPTSFLVDREGRVAKLYRGVVPPEVLRADVSALRSSPERLARSSFPFPGKSAYASFGRSYRHLAMYYVDRKLYPDGLDVLEKAVAVAPRDFVAWAMLGLLREAQGLIDPARRALEEAVRLQPDYVLGNTNLARFYYQHAQPGLAVAPLARAYQVEPNDLEVARQYWVALMDARKFDDAKPVLRAYLRARPADPEAHNALGVAYARTAAPLLAVESFARAFELKPDFAEAAKNLGTALVQTNSLDRAVPALERAAALAPDDADTLYLLAYAYAQRGRPADAERLLRRVLELRPGDPRARQALETLHPAPGGNR
jgi:Flp pilus assembly protein TadD/peroxiredoxin